MQASSEYRDWHSVTRNVTIVQGRRGLGDIGIMIAGTAGRRDSGFKFMITAPASESLAHRDWHSVNVTVTRRARIKSEPEIQPNSTILDNKIMNEMTTSQNNANNCHHFQGHHRLPLLILARVQSDQTVLTQYRWQQRLREEAEHEHTIQNQARPRIP